MSRTMTTRTSRTTRGAAAAMALAAALAVGACGSDTTEGGASGDSGSSAEAGGAGDAQTGETVDGKELADRVVAAMEKAGSGKIALTGGGSESSGAFTIEDGKFQQTMTTEASGQKLDTVSVDGIVYLKGIPGTDPAKPWVKIDPSGDDPLSQMMSSITGNMDLSDPRSMTKAFAGTTANVVSSDASGTVYTFTVKAADLVGPELAQAAGGGEIEVTYTLDGDDRPVKTESKIAGQTSTVTYSDWGTDVSVQAPSADQIGTFELPSLPSGN